MKYALFLFITIICLNAKSQDQPSELITDRPDQTESSAVIPIKSLQIETGFVRAIDDSEESRHQQFAYNSTLLRYGLLKNMELRLGLVYLGEHIEIKNTDSVINHSCFG
jgi:hypothetical protein